MTSYVQRYQQGEYEQVWNELLALGSQVREAPLFSEARSVAYTTMERVRRNLDLLIPRLHNLGYVFGFIPHPEEDMDDLEIAYPPVFTPPDATIRDRISRLERVVGSLPLSVRAFYEVVGGGNLIGRQPHWEPYDRDALMVEFLDERLFKECCAEYDEEHGCWYLAIAPDHFFKDGVGGDGAYEIALPNTAVDAPLLLEWHETTFVNYLRIALQWGGFPGFARIPDPPVEDLAYLTEGLLPM
jgi:hypothetical protein